MNVGRRIIQFISYFIAIAFTLLFSLSSFAQAPENNQMMFEGSLTDTSGNPINLSGVQLIFYVTASNGCYLYGETSTTAGDSQGNINYRIGSGALVGGSPNGFSQNIFYGAAAGTTTFAGNNCSVTASDTRLVQVFYPNENITGTIKLASVPYAYNAKLFNGLSSADFLQVTNDSNILFYSGTSGQYLTKSASGALAWTSMVTSVTSGSIATALGYTPANSATLGGLAVKNSVDLSTVDVTGSLPVSKLPSFSGDVSTAAASSITTVQAIRGIPVAATGPVSGQIMYFNGSAWAPMTVPHNVGTVTNVSSTNGDISITSSTTTPQLSIVTGTSPNQLVRLDGTAKLPGVDGSQLLNLNATNLVSGTLAAGRLPPLGGDVLSVTGSSTVTVTKLRGIDIASATPTVNQVLAYNAGKWIPTTFNFGSVNSVTAGNGLTGGSITSSGTISVNFGNSSGTVAAGNDSRITGALQASNNLADVASAPAARTNLGLGALSTKDQIQLTTDVGGVLPVANGGSKWATFSSGIYTTSNTVIGNGAVSSTSVRLYVETNANAQVARFNNTNPNGLGVRIDTASVSSSQYALNINNASGSIFAVQSDGNIGIGTLSPATALNIVNDNGPSNKDDIQINTFGNNTAALALQKAKGSLAMPAPLVANDAIGNLRWDGYTGSGYANLVAITGTAETDFTTAINAFLSISTNSNGTMAERVRVTSNGNMGIGTASATVAKLHVAGAVVAKPVTISGNNVDLAQSNMFILNAITGSPGTAVSINLSNLIDGGTYTLIISDLNSHTYSFAGCTNAFFAPANSATIPNTRTMFGLVTVKTGSNWDCYINWTPGFL